MTIDRKQALAILQETSDAMIMIDLTERETPLVGPVARENGWYYPKAYNVVGEPPKHRLGASAPRPAIPRAPAPGSRVSRAPEVARADDLGPDDEPHRSTRVPSGRKDRTDLH